MGSEMCIRDSTHGAGVFDSVEDMYGLLPPRRSAIRPCHVESHLYDGCYMYGRRRRKKAFERRKSLDDEEGYRMH